MKNRLLCAAILALISSFAVASCPCDNPLDATADQYAAIRVPPFPTITNNSASYTVAETGVQELHYLAANKDGVDAVLHGMQGNLTLPSSGIVGFEMRVDRFPRQTMSKPGNTILFLLASSGQHYAFRVGLYVLQNAAYTYHGTALDGVFTPYSLTPSMRSLSLPLPANYRIGIYFNMTTRQVGYTLNGVDRGYVIDQIPADVTEITLGLGADTRVEAGDRLIGKQVGGTLITNATKFTQPFPAGTRDICGRLIP